MFPKINLLVQVETAATFFLGGHDEKDRIARWVAQPAARVVGLTVHSFAGFDSASSLSSDVAYPSDPPPPPLAKVMPSSFLL
jgi:hypothetical protein